MLYYNKLIFQVNIFSLNNDFIGGNKTNTIWTDTFLCFEQFMSSSFHFWAKNSTYYTIKCPSSK